MRPSRKRNVLAILLLAYVLLMAFGGCADSLILHPSKGRIDAGPARQMTIPVDGRRLELWTARSPALQSGAEPAAFELEFCGNGTRAEQITQWVAKRWKKHAVEVWVMNYPGYGGSEGGARLAIIPPSALAAYDALAQNAAGRPIFLAGNSLGTTSALYVAAHRPTAGMILQSPPPLQRLILQRYGWWNLWLVAGPVVLQIPEELNSLRNAPNVRAPATFIIGDQDFTVPPYYSRMVYDAYVGPKTLIEIKNGGHNSSVEGDAGRQLDTAIDHLWESAGLH